MNVFASKADRWLVLLAVVPAFGTLGVTLWGVYRAGAKGIPGLVVGLLVTALMVSVFGWTRYVVDGRTLLVRCGPFRWSVPIDEIESVTPTDDPSSAPALSLDRLSIRYGPREILVSPRERERFIEALRAVNPKIA